MKYSPLRLCGIGLKAATKGDLQATLSANHISNPSDLGMFASYKVNGRLPGWPGVSMLTIGYDRDTFTFANFVYENAGNKTYRRIVNKYASAYGQPIYRVNNGAKGAYWGLGSDMQIAVMNEASKNDVLVIYTDRAEFAKLKRSAGKH